MNGGTLSVLAPLAGTIVNLADVPDPVFAQRLVGPGWAIMPSPQEHTIISPIDGCLEILTPHAFVVAGQGGRAVLVHLGINATTGQGLVLHPLAELGQQVHAKQPILRWRPPTFCAPQDLACPVIALSAQPNALAVTLVQEVPAGNQLFSWREGSASPPKDEGI